MILKEKPVELQGRHGRIDVVRNSYGVPEITAGSWSDASFAMGWVHANDRQLQIMLTRIILEGRGAEKLSASRELIETDTYIRSLNLFPDIASQKRLLDIDVRESLDAYSEGINSYLEEGGVIPEFRLMRYRPDPWTAEDTMRLAKSFSYFGLIDVQGDMEKLIVQMIQNGMDEKRLRELFPYLNDRLDYELLKRVKLSPPIVPGAVKWLSILPRFTASNNWAVSGRLTASGKPMLCGDPHLQVNRMPSIWHEAVIRLPNETVTGFAVPGTPVIVVGRNRNLSFSPTYSFMDMIDFSVEECRDGKYRRGTRWHYFDRRDETIKTKRGGEVRASFFENELGVLEGDPEINGFYLVRSWSAAWNCGAMDINGLFGVMKAKTVREGMKHYRLLDAASYNFVMADTAGNIGMQMSGRLFDRPRGVSGLIPHPAWDKKYSPRGYVSKNRLPYLYNPADGIIVTANQDINSLGTSSPINLPMAPYRAERIKQMLGKRNRKDAEYMKEIQYDLYSLQAERLMKIIKPHIPDTDNGIKLKNWDFIYSGGSLGASIFENVYLSLVLIIFGDNGIGRDAVKYVLDETCLFNDYFGNFDSVIFNEKSVWFDRESRESIIRMALNEGLEKPVRPYGKKRRAVFRHLLFGGKIPSIFGLDYGPVEIPGCRASVLQGQIFRSGGREIVFNPSCRIIADMSGGSLLTNTTGGSSDRPFTKWYSSSNKDWFYGIYKVIE